MVAGTFLGIIAVDNNFSKANTMKELFIYFTSDGFLLQIIMYPLVAVILISLSIYIFEEVIKW